MRRNEDTGCEPVGESAARSEAETRGLHEGGGRTFWEPSAVPGLGRAALVARLRRQVEAGTYRVDARKVAAAMLRGSVRRNLWGDNH